jgi:hypothetical protein
VACDDELQHVYRPLQFVSIRKLRSLTTICVDTTMPKCDLPVGVLMAAPKKRKRGRPSKGGPEPARSIRVSDAQWLAIKSAAAREGLTATAWLLGLAQNAIAKRESRPPK